MQRIDAHQHFWQVSRGDYHWLTSDLAPLYRDYLPQDIQPYFFDAGISKSILVQAAASVAETHYLLKLAEEHDFILGVVGWIDMENALASDVLRALAEHPKFIGIRPMIQDIDDTLWVLNPQFDRLFCMLIELNLTFDALVQPRHLGALLTLIQRYPKLKIVIDHGAKPQIDTGNTQEWYVGIECIARQTQAYCKLSGLVTEAGNKATSKQLRPYFQHLLRCFGAGRLMWGSDWPVLNLNSSYPDWISITEDLMSGLRQQDKAALWAGSAKNFYGGEGV